MSRRAKQPEWEQELLRYDEGVHLLGAPAIAEALAAAERRLGRPLCPEHRRFLERHDGGTLFCEAYRLYPAAEIEDDRIGEEGDADLALDARGRVVRIEAGGEEALVVGSALGRWLDAVFAREALVYGPDGEFLDVFEEDRPELRVDVMRRQHERAAARDPESPAWAFELGRLHARAGRLAAAEAELSRAESLDARLVWAPYELGRVLERAGRPAEAVEAFLRAAAADGERAPLMYAHAARVAEERGDRALGSRLRARVKLADPEFARRHREVGRRLLDEGDRNAREMLALALAIDHHDEETRALLARVKRP